MVSILYPLRFKKRGDLIISYGRIDPWLKSLKRIGFRRSRKEGVWFVKDSRKVREGIIYEMFPYGESYIKEMDSNNLREEIKRRYPFIFDYQVDGVLFGISRSILIADEMGLGKSLRALVIKDLVAPDIKCLIL